MDGTAGSILAPFGYPFSIIFGASGGLGAWTGPWRSLVGPGVSDGGALGLMFGALGSFWARRGALWKALGVILDPFGVLLGPFGALWVSFCTTCGSFVRILGAFGHPFFAKGETEKPLIFIDFTRLLALEGSSVGPKWCPTLLDETKNAQRKPKMTQRKAHETTKEH
jgi:hypothetical protein